MADTTIKKIDSKTSPKGADGEKYLASGTHVAMRLWENEQPGEPKQPATRPYETVGYVISGRAELKARWLPWNPATPTSCRKAPPTPTRFWKPSRR